MLRHLLCLIAIASLAVPAWSQTTYTIYSNVGTSFTDISATGTNRLSLVDDDVTSSITIPFTFNLYGVNYNSVVASSNGNLQFGGSPNTAYNNFSLLSSNTPNAAGFVAPYWDDLDATGGFSTPAGSIFTQTIGAPGSQVFIAQWHQWGHNADGGTGNPDNTITFQIKLFEGSNNIAFIYEKKIFPLTGFDNGESATIGISSGDFNDLNNPVAEFSFDTASLGSVNDLLFTTVAVPEPATLFMIGTSGVMGLAVAYRIFQGKRRQRRKTA